MDQIDTFTEKARFYHHRWDYAEEAIDEICRTINGCHRKKIVDLGAGNGMSSKHFLVRGADVFAVEPNRAMIARARQALQPYPNFFPYLALARATALPSQFADAIVVGRALQWFEPQSARQEMGRIIKPNGLLAILRVQPAEPRISQALYSIRLAEFGWDMRNGGRRPSIPPHEIYYGHRNYRTVQYSEVISQDFTQFFGELCSRSSAPKLGSRKSMLFREAARELFEQLGTGEALTIETITTVSLGKMIDD